MLRMFKKRICPLGTYTERERERENPQKRNQGFLSTQNLSGFIDY